MKNYSAPDSKNWTGRIDDPLNQKTFRIHQSISYIDMNLEELPQANGTAFVLLGFCCDEGIRRNQGRVGAAHGPKFIRKALGPIPWNTQKPIFDAGDVTCENEDMEAAQDLLSSLTARMLDKGYFPLVMGGGHEVAFGHFKGFRKHIEKKEKNSWGIVNMDAHFDLRPVRDMGNSGTGFSQIADLSREKGDRFRYMVLGIKRSGNTELLFNRADSLGVTYLTATELYEPSETSEEIIQDFIAPCDHLYLTLCSDVFSTAYVPGVSAPQPLGLAPQRILALMASIIASGKVRCMDVAEISPAYDHDERSSRIAALMLYEVMQLMS